MSRLIEWTGERFVPWVSDAPIAYEHVHRYLWAAELVGGRRVLDLGSGEGFGSALLAHSASRVQGVDIDLQAVEHARAHYRAPNLSFDVADARQLDVFEDASFGAVVCFEVIEHLREQEVLLEGVARVLAPDGLLIVSTPDREAYNRTTSQPNDFHERELSENEFRDLLSERFPHVGLWGQSLAMGSRLAARGEGEPTTQRFFVERRDTTWLPTEEPGPVYLVAVAARAALPAAPVESVLVDSGVMIISQLEAKVAELHEVNSAFGESIDAINRLEHKVSRLDGALAESMARVAVVEGSASWRLIQAARERVGPDTAVGRMLSAVVHTVERFVTGRGPRSPGPDR